jgi:hypothetical protein
VSVTPVGVTRITYSATDVAGNVSATRSQTVVVGLGFACSGPTATFSMPKHGTLDVTGTASANGKTYPFSQIISF